MTKFYFPHVQTVLKITSTAVQTIILRLDQSQSWNFMKVAPTKITAYWGWTPPQKSDIMCIHNHFWPTSKRKVFKIGRKSTVASAVILTLDQKSAVRPSVGWNFKKKFSSAFSLDHPWTLMLKQFFNPMHTVGSTVTESKKQLTHVKSGQKLQCPGTAKGGSQKFFLYHPGRRDR